MNRPTGNNRRGVAEGRQSTSTRSSPAISRSGTMSPQPNHSKPAPPAAARGSTPSGARRDVPGHSGTSPRSGPRRATPGVAADDRKHNRTPTSDEEEAYSRLTRDQAIAALKSIKQDKEELSHSLQQANEAIEDLRDRNLELVNNLEAAQNQSQDHFADQERVDTDLAELQRQCDTLRSQLKDSEKTRRDLDKRSKEEVSHFESERTSWLETEKNLRGRIQELKKRPMPDKVMPDENIDHSTASTSEEESEVPGASGKRSLSGKEPSLSPPPLQPINPNPELVATLAQLQADFDALQVQHEDLVLQADKASEEIVQLQQSNYRLQDENESFTILLGERTLRGEILGQGVFGQSWDGPINGKSGHTKSSPDPATLRPKASPRLAEVLEEDDELFESHGDGAADSGAVAANDIEKRRKGRLGKRGKAKAPTGGLDLAAELDRAEESATEPDEDEKSMRRGPSLQSYADWTEERLVSEIKALKDANKALTLYINRIVERVIASEGFEAVLASDAQRASPPPMSPSLLSSSTNNNNNNNNIGRPRPPLQTQISSSSAPATSPVSSTPADKTHKRASSRMSLSGLAASLFGSAKPPASDDNTTSSHLKPLQLGNPNAQATRSRSTSPAPSKPSTNGDTEHGSEEQEEESRERDRINAELASMGIEEEAGSPGLRQAQRNSISQTIDRPMPDATSTFAEQQQQQQQLPKAPKAAALAAVDPITSINEWDKHSRSELKSGRASGFTEPKRVSARARRDPLRSSSLTNDFGPVGQQQGSSEDLSNSSADLADQSTGWGTKLLRRVSLTGR